MESMTKKQIETNPLHVLLIGNNPIELSGILEKLNQIRGPRIVTEIAFDLQSILQRLVRFQPHFILLDDNIGRTEMALTIQALESNHKTKNVPITLLKSSNYEEALGASGILDYLLKQNLSSDGIYTMLRNSLKFKRTQEYLYNAYQKRREQLSKLVR
jgi:DNA-binding NarL/FixJ family response regulator